MADPMDPWIKELHAMQQSINLIPWRSLKLDGTATGSRCARSWLTNFQIARFVSPSNYFLPSDLIKYRAGAGSMDCNHVVTNISRSTLWLGGAASSGVLKCSPVQFISLHLCFGKTENAYNLAACVCFVSSTSYSL